MLPSYFQEQFVQHLAITTNCRVTGICCQWDNLCGDFLWYWWEAFTQVPEYVFTGCISEISVSASSPLECKTFSPLFHLSPRFWWNRQLHRFLETKHESISYPRLWNCPTEQAPGLLRHARSFPRHHFQTESVREKFCNLTDYASRCLITSNFFWRLPLNSLWDRTPGSCLSLCSACSGDLRGTSPCAGSLKDRLEFSVSALMLRLLWLTHVNTGNHSPFSQLCWILLSFFFFSPFIFCFSKDQILQWRPEQSSW